ncbi:MAG: hypothetical protein ACI8QZ_000658 [Chlamydiales bacterium]|jgi:hypothetical protein
MTLSRSLFNFLLLTSLAPFARAGVVHVVDSATPGAFQQIQDAVDAAVGSDVVLVRSGTYAGFEIVAKEIAVVADEDALVLVGGAIRVVSLSASQDVLLSGLHATGTLAAGGELRNGLALLNNAGSVRLLGCDFEAAMGGMDPSCTRSHGALVENCADVAFTACLLRGRSSDFAGGNGLELRASAVALYDSALVGGDGGPAFPCQAYMDGGNGGSGVQHADLVHLLLQNTSCAGGDGGLEGTPQAAGECLFPGAGGNALRRFGFATSTPALLACPLSSGATAPCTGNTCSFVDCPPPPVAHVFGRSVTLQGRAPTLDSARVLRDGELLTLSFNGLPGDRVGLFLSDETAYRALARGVDLVQESRPRLVLIAGVIDATGTLTRSLSIPALAPGEEARTLYLQAQHRGPTGFPTLSGLASVVIVDATL